MREAKKKMPRQNDVKCRDIYYAICLPKFFISPGSFAASFFLLRHRCRRAISNQSSSTSHSARTKCFFYSCIMYQPCILDSRLESSLCILTTSFMYLCRYMSLDLSNCIAIAVISRVLVAQSILCEARIRLNFSFFFSSSNFCEVIAAFSPA